MPTILEIYLLWHPDDRDGNVLYEDFLGHFHGDPYSGLLRDAVEVYGRSAGWSSREDAPRPIPWPGTAAADGGAPAAFVAVVPVLGRALARAVEDGDGPWHRYLREVERQQAAPGGRVGVFPLQIHRGVTDEGTVLGTFFPRIQQLARPDATDPSPPEPVVELRRRDLAQGLVRLLDGGDTASRLTVFISHTKREAVAAEREVVGLIAATKAVFGGNRLKTFFDAKDLEPGADWDAALRFGAATSALLVLRTDLYATRLWCQREMVLAKQAGMPIVVLDVLCHGEERGSFLLDHVPRRPVRRDADGRWLDDIRAGVNRLVDECLKRALWRQQERLEKAAMVPVIHWWAPHAPEAVTLVHWLQGRLGSDGKTPVRVLHPDPPLVAVEREQLDDIARLAGYSGLDAVTPHTLAARDGR